MAFAFCTNAKKANEEIPAVSKAAFSAKGKDKLEISFDANGKLLSKEEVKKEKDEKK